MMNRWSSANNWEAYISIFEDMYCITALQFHTVSRLSGWLRGHQPDYRVRQGHRVLLRHLRGPGHRPADPHNRQQLCSLLQERTTERTAQGKEDCIGEGLEKRAIGPLQDRRAWQCPGQRHGGLLARVPLLQGRRWQECPQRCQGQRNGRLPEARPRPENSSRAEASIIGCYWTGLK